MMAAEQTIEQVVTKFGEMILEPSAALGQASFSVESANWRRVAEWLCNDAGFTFLSDLCGVDWPDRDPRFEVVCNLLNMQDPSRLRVKVRVPGDPPTLRSVTDLWPTANWHERETFDMFGVVFEGHPDLRRILMPDEWEGHPLRKDYAVGKIPVEYKQLSPGF